MKYAAHSWLSKPRSLVLNIKAILGILVLSVVAAHPLDAQTPPYRIGLNFAFVGATNTTIAQVFTNLVPLGLRGTRHPSPADVTWSSLQTRSNTPPNFTTADQVFFNTNGLATLGTLYDDPNITTSPGLQVPWLTGSGFNFTSNELYYASNYVRTVVSRYSGVTHHWEISNEVDTQTNRARSLPASEFAAFLITNRNWIRAVDPQAQVVLPGCLGNYGYPVTNSYAWLRQVLSNGGAAGFDVVNYHDYRSWWVLPGDFDGFRAVLAEFNLTNMPIWITECSSASVAGATNSTVPYASEDQQAADVWRRSTLLFGKGASVWFWHSLYSSPSGGFANQGLLTPASATPSGQKLKAWHAFRLLVQKIEGFQSASVLQLGNATSNNTSGGEGQWAVQFDWADGTRRHVVWSGTNLNYTLTNLAANPYRVTTVVPATISSDGETATFTIVTNTPTAGALALVGANLPVLVECTVPTAPVITSATLGNGGFTFNGNGPTAETYRVFATTNVALPFANWSQISSGTFTNSAFQVTDTAATNSAARYYRLSVP